MHSSPRHQNIPPRCLWTLTFVHWLFQKLYLFWGCFFCLLKTLSFCVSFNIRSTSSWKPSCVSYPYSQTQWGTNLVPPWSMTPRCLGTPIITAVSLTERRSNASGASMPMCLASVLRHRFSPCLSILSWGCQQSLQSNKRTSHAEVAEKWREGGAIRRFAWSTGAALE